MLSTLKTEVSQLSKTDAKKTRALSVLPKSKFTKQYVRRRIRNFSNYPWRGFLPLRKGSRIPILGLWGFSIRSAILYRTLEYERGDRDCQN